MRSPLLLKQWAKSAVQTGIAAVLVSTTALADDTEIYRGDIRNSAPPNLLFVLDYSGSMNFAIDGAYPDQPGEQSRATILKSAVRQVLKNNAGSVNIGFGSLYSTTPSGVQWPISDLTADANDYDPSIPEGITTAEIMSRQLDSRQVLGATATVDALTEAAAYFGGASVFHNGSDTKHAESHRPDRFNPATGQIINGYHDAAIPASYSPVDAYSATGGDGSFYSTCFDYTINGTVPNEVNHCANLPVTGCRIAPRGTVTFDGGRTNRQSRQCRYSTQERWTGATYNSPINAECQVNAIILVTDGTPTIQRNQANTAQLIGKGQNGCDDLTEIFGNGNDDETVRSRNSGRCGPEIAEYLANNPQVPGIDDSTVRTYTVGFNAPGAAQIYLDRIAELGDGDSFHATTPESLSNALDQILMELSTTSQGFAPLAVDVDRANLSHDDRLFYSLFEPSEGGSWSGNLKGYFLRENGLTDINNAEATSVMNGVRLMKDGAQSFWSASPDGDDVLSGGATELMQSGKRNLYTYTGGNNIPRAGVNLTTSGQHDLVASNNRISAGLLGGTNNRNAVLDWVQNAPMGDPLHSQPVQIDYGNQQVMFVMTNQGFLHAIDSSEPTRPNGSIQGGEELFAFMPKELLKNLPKHYENVPSIQRTYGLDGALVRWHDDANQNGIVDGNDKAMLIFGMRRGGNHYYAVDVTNPRSPRYMWRIDGGQGQFGRLGETWSRPTLVNVKRDGVKTQVIAFAGGYDAKALDGSTSRVENVRGNAIYFVDRNGELVLRIDGTTERDMKYAIPSDLTVVDTDGDSLTDRIYVGDLGGQIWRVDFDDIRNGAEATVIADFSDQPHTTFFYPPSVALNSSVYGDFLSVSIGSGNRTNPLRTNSQDRIYMIRDRHVNEPLPANFTRTYTRDLFNATSNDIGSDNKRVADIARELLNRKNGWFIELGLHEKSLSQLVTFEGRILATTFDLDAATLLDPCGFTSTNRFYGMDLATAQPLPNTSGLGTASTTALTPEDRFSTVNGDGILSQPVVVFTPTSDDVLVLVDNEIVTKFDRVSRRIYWYAR